jgi:hypothetical protein
MTWHCSRRATTPVWHAGWVVLGSHRVHGGFPCSIPAPCCASASPRCAARPSVFASPCQAVAPVPLFAATSPNRRLQPGRRRDAHRAGQRRRRPMRPPPTCRKGLQRALEQAEHWPAESAHSLLDLSDHAPANATTMFRPTSTSPCPASQTAWPARRGIRQPCPRTAAWWTGRPASASAWSSRPT